MTEVELSELNPKVDSSQYVAQFVVEAFESRFPELLDNSSRYLLFHFISDSVSELIKEQTVQLRSALEVYANPDYWQAIQGDDQEYLYIESIGQKSYVQGKIARAALEEK